MEKTSGEVSTIRFWNHHYKGGVHLLEGTLLWTYVVKFAIIYSSCEAAFRLFLEREREREREREEGGVSDGDR